ncbi:acetoacetate decarboxylase family protein [Aliikangiella sp. G2MR2-5]|uniref:acetoacetate decarboxylase family protein n=1 Tax=Aliikangiella sp. G2MR2-5 TaxID=2788943 RepID=UPI0018AA069F|nr:acetoacetate decarboxylase family protein [Aliikangiella sp. G2MR2-5]
MNPSNQIVPGLQDNQSEFNDPFFKRFQLRTAAEPLALNEQISKDYLFPTLYGNVSCAIGVFLCNRDKAQALLPHSKMKPVAMPGGKALVTFSCYEYKQVLGIAPYNEIAMTIPVMIDPMVNVPVLPMLIQKFKRFGYYVFHMPVTSKENRIRGQKIWGLPKQVETINIGIDGDTSTTEAIDAAGNHYFSLKVPTCGKKQLFDVQSNLYSRLGDQLLQSTTCFNGTFSVNKFTDRLWRNGGDDPGVLSFGEGPYGDMLRALEIEPQPFQFRYTPSMNACFDLPNPDYCAPFDFIGRPEEVTA